MLIVVERGKSKHQEKNSRSKGDKSEPPEKAREKNWNPKN
jgi:hypothetical protein